MRDEYDLSEARRGAVVQSDGRKRRITIRLDGDIVEWFRRQVELRGGGHYQSLINQALRQHVERSSEALESTLRRVLREELARLGGPEDHVET